MIVLGTSRLLIVFGAFFFAASASQFARVVSAAKPGTAFTISFTVFRGLIFGRLGAWFLKPSGSPLTPMIRALYLTDGAGFLASIFAIAALIAAV